MACSAIGANVSRRYWRSRMSRSCASCLSVRSASASRCCCASVMSFSRCFLAALSVTAATITAAPKPEMRPAMTAGHVSAASTMIGGITLDLCRSGGRTLAAAIVTVVVSILGLRRQNAGAHGLGISRSLSSTLPLRVKSDCAQGRNTQTITMDEDQHSPRAPRLRLLRGKSERVRRTGYVRELASQTTAFTLVGAVALSVRFGPCSVWWLCRSARRSSVG